MKTNVVLEVHLTRVVFFLLSSDDSSISAASWRPQVCCCKLSKSSTPEQRWTEEMGHFIEPFTNTQSTDIWPWWYFAVAKKNFLITLIYTHPLINWHSYYKTLSQELRVLWIKLWIAFKYKDINHKHFKHQPPTNVQPLCVVIIPGQSPQCRFSSSLTHTQLLLFLVEIYHEKKIRFYLLFFFKFKLINISDQLNKPFFWAILITCVQIMPFEQTGWGRELGVFLGGGSDDKKRQ